MPIEICSLPMMRLYFEQKDQTEIVERYEKHQMCYRVVIVGIFQSKANGLKVKIWLN